MSNATQKLADPSAMTHSSGSPGFDPKSYLPESVAPYLEDTLDSVEKYAREKPWAFGLCMLGVGFVVGWKLKPW